MEYVMSQRQHAYREGSYRGTKCRAIFLDGIQGKCVSLKTWVKAGVGHWRQAELYGPTNLARIAHLREMGKDWRDKP